MRTGMITTALLDRSLEDALDFTKSLGVHTVEIAAAGGFWPARHCDPRELVSDASRTRSFAEQVSRRGMDISALAIHGNPLDPDEHKAAEYWAQYQAACELAERIGVSRLTLLAGLPGAGPHDQFPNWIVFPFPNELQEALKWQWEERVLPYWEKAARIAVNTGVKLCFEMVPNDTVYSPATLLRLREAIGPVAGANLDPSHFLFQQIDPITAIEALGDAIYHVHAKDVAYNPRALRLGGVLDMNPLGSIAERSWAYRTLGWGQDESYWTAFITALRLQGYDDVLSIEHEDTLLSADEGMRKAVAFLERLIPSEPANADWMSLL